MAHRVARRIGDVAVDTSVADAADFVVLHRVVCCYPDVEALIGAAARHARRGVVLTYPRPSIAMRAVSAIVNAVQWAQRAEYRSFIHSPDVILDVLRGQGFDADPLAAGPVWDMIGARRESGA